MIVGIDKIAQTDHTLSVYADLTSNEISDFRIVKPKNAPETVCCML